MTFLAAPPAAVRAFPWLMWLAIGVAVAWLAGLLWLQTERLHARQIELTAITDDRDRWQRSDQQKDEVIAHNRAEFLAYRQALERSAEAARQVIETQRQELDQTESMIRRMKNDAKAKSDDHPVGATARSGLEWLRCVEDHAGDTAACASGDRGTAN